MNFRSPEPASERFGRLAFAYCKIATVSLIAGRFALPVAAFLSALFFVVSYVRGKKDTKCYLQNPLLAAGFWIVILVAWVLTQLYSASLPEWFRAWRG